MNQNPFGLGIVVPSANSIMERDFIRVPLDGVSFHFARVLNSEDTAEQLEAMKDRAAEAASLISHARGVKAVALGCTSGSFIGGVGYDARVASAMTAACDLPSTTTSEAILAAIDLLGLKRLAVFDPYPEWLSGKLVDYLRGNGVNVISNAFGFDMGSTEGLDDYEPINRWVVENLPAEADGVYIACTNFTWLRGIAPLERQIGRPVLTSNLATLWRLLALAGRSDLDLGLGTTLEQVSLG